MSTYIEYVHARPEFDETLFKLSAGNHFTAADLDANRKGQVGADQFKHHLNEALSGPLLVLAAGVAISFLVRLAFAGYVEHQNIFRFIGKLLDSLFLWKFGRFQEIYLTTGGERLPIIVSAFVVTAPMFSYRKLRHLPVRMLIELIRGNVKRLEASPFSSSEEVKAPGRAGKKGEMITKYYYQIGDLKLNVCSEGHSALAMGLKYRIYYLPASKTLLSIEPMMG